MGLHVVAPKTDSVKRNMPVRILGSIRKPLVFLSSEVKRSTAETKSWTAEKAAAKKQARFSKRSTWTMRNRAFEKPKKYRLTNRFFSQIRAQYIPKNNWDSREMPKKAVFITFPPSKTPCKKKASAPASVRYCASRQTDRDIDENVKKDMGFFMENFPCRYIKNRVLFIDFGAKIIYNIECIGIAARTFAESFRDSETYHIYF